MQTLGEDLVLLSISPRSGRLSNASRLRFGLMGSELAAAHSASAGGAGHH